MVNARLIMLNVKELANYLHCSEARAREIFKNEKKWKFPTIKVGKNYQVELNALLKWLGERRISED